MKTTPTKTTVMGATLELVLQSITLSRKAMVPDVTAGIKTNIVEKKLVKETAGAPDLNMVHVKYNPSKVYYCCYNNV